MNSITEFRLERVKESQDSLIVGMVCSKLPFLFFHNFEKSTHGANALSIWEGGRFVEPSRRVSNRYANSNIQKSSSILTNLYLNLYQTPRTFYNYPYQY